MVRSVTVDGALRPSRPGACFHKPGGNTPGAGRRPGGAAPPTRSTPAPGHGSDAPSARPRPGAPCLTEGRQGALSTVRPSAVLAGDVGDKDVDDALAHHALSDLPQSAAQSLDSGAAGEGAGEAAGIGMIEQHLQEDVAQL